MALFISQHIISILLTLGLTAAFTGIGFLVKQFTAFKASIIAMNHDRLYQACSFYIRTGEITFQELSNLEYLYSPYTKLGGNGTGETLYQECKELPKVEQRTHFDTNIIKK